MRSLAIVVGVFSFAVASAALAAQRRPLSEMHETHKKVERHADGSERVQTDEKKSVDRGQGEIVDEQHVLVETRPTDHGGKTITREVTKSHDAPGWKNDRKTHVKETIEKDRHGRIVKHTRTE
jgi:hypothetical protein